MAAEYSAAAIAGRSRIGRAARPTRKLRFIVGTPHYRVAFGRIPDRLRPAVNRPSQASPAVAAEPCREAARRRPAPPVRSPGHARSRVGKSGSSPACASRSRSAAGRLLRLERAVDAKPQDLGQGLIEAERRQEDFRLAGREKPGLGRRGQHRLGLGRNDVRMARRHGGAAGTGRRTRCRPGRPAPASGPRRPRRPWPPRPWRACRARRLDDGCAGPRPRDDRRRSRFAARFIRTASPAIGRARVSAMCSQVQASFAW